jgi:glyceraldehyde-3-phosphate dehydrogenase (NADP+)
MLVSVLLVVALPLNHHVHAAVDTESTTTTTTCATKLQQLLDVPKPYVTTSTWLPNTIDLSTMEMMDVKSSMGVHPTKSYCNNGEEEKEDVLPIIEYDSVVIGQMPQMQEQDALHVLETANTAWDKGTGIWTTQYTTSQRMAAIHKVLHALQQPTKRNEIIQILQWEIGKNYIDAAAEFDRTIQFAKQVMNYMVNHPEYMGGKKQFTDYVVTEADTTTSTTTTTPSSSYTAYTKRTAVGIILMLAPYNYPINECYATLLPALLLGNICIVKIPAVGGLAHLLTMEAFAQYLPHGTINFISGSGAKVLPALLKTGDIHGMAMIGSSKSADQLIRYHTQPHRFQTFLQLGAKNVAIVLPDVFQDVTEDQSTTIFDNMITESILGSLSYNGQRCTALKIFFVPKVHADLFVAQFSKAVEALNIGLPWQNHTLITTKDKKMVTYSQITPLPNQNRIQFLKARIDDAIKKGATITNTNGGNIIGGNTTSTLMIPAIVYPVKPNMKLYTEEQFGPIIPIVPYDTISEIYNYILQSEFAQQISVFGQDPNTMTNIVDTLGSVIPKINFNSQCARSPDVLPFAARRSSGIGIMSVSDVLEEFSIPTVLAYQSKDLNDPIAQELFQLSTFLGVSSQDAATAAQ